MIAVWTGRLWLATASRHKVDQSEEVDPDIFLNHNLSISVNGRSPFIPLDTQYARRCSLRGADGDRPERVINQSLSASTKEMYSFSGAAALGEAEADGLTDGLTEAEGETDGDAETDGLIDAEGETEADGETEGDGLAEGLTEAEGDRLALGLTQGL